MGENKDIDLIQDTFGLTNTEFARLFGINRQALDYWRSHGVPGNRIEKVATVAALAELLQHHLKPQRIAAVVRRHTKEQEGENMLELITKDEHRKLLEDTRQLFDWGSLS